MRACNLCAHACATCICVGAHTVRVFSQVSLPALLGASVAEGGMLAGLTAATGKQFASHCIESWSLYEVATARAEVAQGSWLARARNLVGA